MLLSIDVCLNIGTNFQAELELAENKLDILPEIWEVFFF